MADIVERTTVTESDGMGGTATRTVTARSNFLGDFFVSKTNQVIFSILAIINLLLLVRFILLLLGANQVGIVSWLIVFTEFLVAPFYGIFSPAEVQGGYFEAASIVAMITYTVIAYILSVIIGLFSDRDV